MRGAPSLTSRIGGMVHVEDLDSLDLYRRVFIRHTRSHGSGICRKFWESMIGRHDHRKSKDGKVVHWGHVDRRPVAHLAGRRSSTLTAIGTPLALIDGSCCRSVDRMVHDRGDNNIQELAAVPILLKS